MSTVLSNKHVSRPSISQTRDRLARAYDSWMASLSWLYQQIISQQKDIKDLLELNEMTPTVVALTDGFNNQSARDTCRSNASRLNQLLKHLDRVRSPEEGADPRRRPSVYTVGLGRPLRPGFKLPTDDKDKVKAVDICGRRNVDRRIDGELEERGISQEDWEEWMDTYINIATAIMYIY